MGKIKKKRNKDRRIIVLLLLLVVLAIPLIYFKNSRYKSEKYEISSINQCAAIKEQQAEDSKAVDTSSCLIEMKNILQDPELPTGCEATALTIVLNNLGYNVDKCEIVDNYLPVTLKSYSTNTHYVGNPYSTHGCGCNAPVIIKTANAFFETVKGKFKAIDKTGSAPSQLYDYVFKGYPVVCWATIKMEEPTKSWTWDAEDTGELITFINREHCTVLVGYDKNTQTVTLNDPLEGIVEYPMELFEKRYEKLGKQAIIFSDK